MSENSDMVPVDLDALGMLGDLGDTVPDVDEGGGATVYNQGKDDFWTYGEDKTRKKSVFGILLYGKKLRSWWDPSDQSMGRQPECFSIGETGAHPWSKVPQSDGPCADCPMNQWGSKDNNPDGRGAKACKTKRGDIILELDGDADFGNLGLTDAIGQAIIRYNVSSSQANAALRSMAAEAKDLLRKAEWMKAVPEAQQRMLLDRATSFVVTEFGWKHEDNRAGTEFAVIDFKPVAVVPPALVGDIIATMKDLDSGSDDVSGYVMLERVSGSPPEQA
jgi:hypothetical protein